MRQKPRTIKKTTIIGFLVSLALLLVTACDGFQKPLPAPDYGPLQEELRGYIQTQEGRIGIFFQDIPSGASFGINEREPIGAASSIKAPIVLYLFQQAADGIISLEEKVAYQAETDYQGGAGAIQFFAADGTPYSLALLANLVITLSDNIAWNMLERRLGRDNIANYLWSIGGETVYPEGQNISTARDFGVYLQAILNFRNQHPELGELLLDYMSHTIWDQDGIPNGVPDEVRVAHKVGTVRQIANDIGIVFLEDRPYILSVMTDGLEDGFGAIAAISDMVYRYHMEVMYPR